MQKGWLKVEALQKIQLPAGELKLPCGIRLLNAAVPLYTGAGTEYFMMGTIADDHELEIVEEREGKGQRLWGRLRNNAGWTIRHYRTYISEKFSSGKYEGNQFYEEKLHSSF